MIYDNIKAIAIEKNISIRAIEKKTCIGNGTIGKWKLRESTPSVKSLIKVADALGVSLDDLVKDKEG